MNSTVQLFLIFLRLGLTSFGGPVAHLGYFRTEFVARRQWMTEAAYADLVALCQFLPGPASSQVGMGIGLARGGVAGALAAWAGFTLPSAIALIAFALGLSSLGDAVPTGVLQSLKAVAVAVVAQAVWGMGKSLCPDAPRVSLMAAAAGLVLWMPSALGQVLAILLAGVVGALLHKPEDKGEVESIGGGRSRRTGAAWLSLFALLLVGLPIAAALLPSQTLAVVDAFYRAGSLVFGGGHVVLPLLEAEVVSPGWVSAEAFVAGYGATQAVPGPLFTFAAFLGASVSGEVSGWQGGLLALVAVFVPSFLLVAGALPFWEELRRLKRIRAALWGVNAAVVGILLAALYDPVWTRGVTSAFDLGLVVASLVALMAWRLPAWLVVLGCAGVGAVVK